eukprot:s2931_g2.t1
MAWGRIAAVSRACVKALPAVSVGAVVSMQPAACSSRDKADKQHAFWIGGSSQGCSKTLPCKFDFYGGVIVDPAAVPAEENTFRNILASSLDEWRKQGKRGVWLHLDIGSASLVPIAASEFGFEYHHAEKDYVMMTKWLPDSPNTLPANASHTIGVGALVTNSEGKVLLVREKSGPAAKHGFWKIPTGLVDAGEDLHEAAVREVKEETGIDASFECLGAFTMSHGGNLAHARKSNLFFVVKCQARTTEIQACQSEIAEARWFSREEWLSLPFPERGSIWDELNQSAFAEDVLSMKSLPWGKSRPDACRWLYYPVRRSAL